MKKLIIGLMLLAQLAYAGTWLTGTVNRVIVYGNQEVGVELKVGTTLYNKKIMSTHAYKKEIFASALTAKASTLPVQMFIESNVWKGITLSE